MRHVVGVAEMKIASEPSDFIVTHALGSCLGISVYDPVARVGGILHVMLPCASVSPEKAAEKPFMFVDTGAPRFFKEIFDRGGLKSRLIIKVAGGACIGDNKEDFFAIGKRNLDMLRKLFWKNGIVIDNQDVGGKIARTMFLDIDSGRTWLQSNGREWDL